MTSPDQSYIGSKGRYLPLQGMMTSSIDKMIAIGAVDLQLENRSLHDPKSLKEWQE